MSIRHGLPTLQVIGNSIPQTCYRAIKAVYENGLHIQELSDDCQDENDQPVNSLSIDATVMIEVLDPFAQPRYSPVSFSQIGILLLEILGIKNSKVFPYKMLNFMTFNHKINGNKNIIRDWVYTYNQRFYHYPDEGIFFFDQVTFAIKKLIKNIKTRDAIITVTIPNLDPFFQQENTPDLREIQLRCFNDEAGILWLNPWLSWRSCNLYQNWSDNAIVLTFWLQLIAKEIAEQIGKEVRLGSYKESFASLYFDKLSLDCLEGNSETNRKSFFERFPNEEEFIRRSLTSNEATEMLIIPQMYEILSKEKIKEHDFSETEIDFIKEIIRKIQFFEATV